MHKYHKYIFFAIIFLALFFRLWGIPGSDLKHDAALNSVRAYGWLDYLTGKGQTSPITWFDTIPWWGHLSFHDHPPLVFAIQYIFFSLFGGSTLIALLPFILGGVGVVWLIYFIVKQFRSEQEAWLASFIFAFSAYSVWISRSGYLEGVSIFFIFLSFCSFLLFLRSGQKKYAWFWSVAAGLALLSKYTSIFILPAVLVYLVIWDRKIFKVKTFWLSLLLIPVLLSPVIIYNIYVFQTRGHFDAAFSSMIGLQPEDFSVLSYRTINLGVPSNFLSIFTSIQHFSSWPFFILALLSLLYLLFKVVKKESGELANFLLINLVFIIAMFTFAGGAARFLGIITPFLAISLSLLMYDAFYLVNSKKVAVQVFTVLLVLIFGFELFYSINTNLLVKPVGARGLAYSQERFYESGFAQLEDFLKNNAFEWPAKKRTVNSFTDITQYRVLGRKVILFDERVNWFSRMWHIDRYILYYDVPVFYFTDLNVLVAESKTDKNFLDYLKEDLGATGFWFVASVGPGISDDNNPEYGELVRTLESQLIGAGIKPRFEAKNYLGETSFRVYYFE